MRTRPGGLHGYHRILLLAAAVIPFCGSLGSGFHFDDYAIFQDAGIRAPNGWWAVWNLHQTRPLTYFTFWLNYRLGGEGAVGWHAVNLALHAAAVLVLYEVLRRIGGRRDVATSWRCAGQEPCATFAALIFAVHPIQSEAVDYVWGRSIVLAAIFSFLAWRDWLDSREWRAVAWFAVALLAKEECAAFPLALALWGGYSRKRLWALGAMFLLSLLAAGRVVYALAVTPGAPAGAQAGITPWRYWLAQGPVVWRYLRLLALPIGFTVDPQIGVPATWIGIAAWAALIGAAVYLWRYSRWFAVGLALLLPSSSIFPAEDLAADRRMYLAMAAFAVAMVQLGRRIPCPTWAAAVLVTILAALSVGRTYIWMSDERLWREAVAHAPDKTRPRIQLARSVGEPEALALLADARRLSPNDPNVATETGKVLLTGGNAAAALAEFGRALALDPRDARNYNNRGAALMALGQRDAARQDFQHALRLDPELTEARQNLSRLGM